MIAITIDSLPFLAMVTNDECDLSGVIYRIAGSIAGKFGEMTRFEHLAKESLAN